MHPDFTTQAVDIHRAEAERSARQSRLAREAREAKRQSKDHNDQDQRPGGVRTVLRSVLGLAA